MRILAKTGVAGGLLYCMTLSPAQAQGEKQDIESLTALEQQLQDFLGKGQGETGGARHGIDRRLKLKKCPEPPVIEKRSENLAFIRCEPFNWRISVPLVRNNNGGRRASVSPIIVKRGQVILLVVQKSGFMISRRMQADRSGSLGDVIPVRTTRRSPPILAKITGEGRVTLPSY